MNALLAYRVAEEYPGRSAGELAALAGVERKNAASLLLTMEENGFLLSEDERGRLYPFRDIGRDRIAAQLRGVWGEVRG